MPLSVIAFSIFILPLYFSKSFGKIHDEKFLPELIHENTNAQFFSAVNAVKRDPQLFASPIISPADVWLSTMERKFIALDSTFGNTSSTSTRAIEAYSNFLLRMVNGLNFWESELSTFGDRTIRPLNMSVREGGLDWAYLGYSMVGTVRLKNLFELLQHIDKESIPGSVIETGVWRGGASMYMAGIMNALKMSTKKLQIVADSFQGLPPGNNQSSASIII